MQEQFKIVVGVAGALSVTLRIDVKTGETWTLKSMPGGNWSWVAVPVQK